MPTPSNPSAYSSTIWNKPAKAYHSVNAPLFGGPNVNIKEGSKVQFADGQVVWDVARVFNDGTLYLVATTSGTRITRKIPPTSTSWTNILMVDSRRFKQNEVKITDQKAPIGGGPGRNIDPGNIISLGNSKVKWVVDEVRVDGTLVVQSFSGDKVTRAEIGPASKYWDSIRAINK